MKSDFNSSAKISPSGSFLNRERVENFFWLRPQAVALPLSSINTVIWPYTRPSSGPPSFIIATCFVNLSDSHMSSQSRNAHHSPRAWATARFQACPKAVWIGARKYRQRGSA